MGCGALPVSKKHFFSVCYGALICTVRLAHFLVDGLTEDAKWKVICSDGLLGGAGGEGLFPGVSICRSYGNSLSARS